LKERASQDEGLDLIQFGSLKKGREVNCDGRRSTGRRKTLEAI